MYSVTHFFRCRRRTSVINPPPFQVQQENNVLSDPLFQVQQEDKCTQ